MQHPAVLAWFQIDGNRPIPSKVEHIYGKLRKKPVFRLHDVEAGNRSIIAKRCYTATGKIEDSIYRKILPTLGFPAPCYFGLIAEDEKYSWLFFEDLGEIPFLYDNSKHRDAASRWLGRLHSEATQLPKSIKLESRGPGYYFNHLHAGRSKILKNMDNPSFGEDNCSLLLEIVKLLDLIASGWDNISSACDDMPKTFVHGGIKPLNMLVREEREELIVYFIDWEVAGWGVPAPDLAPRSQYPNGLINAKIYLQYVNDQWPGMKLKDIKRMAATGYFFRRLAATDWATSSFSRYPEGALRLLEIYLKDLTKSMSLKPWDY